MSRTIDIAVAMRRIAINIKCFPKNVLKQNYIFWFAQEYEVLKVSRYLRDSFKA